MRRFFAAHIIGKVFTTLLFSSFIICSALAESIEIFDTNNGGIGKTSELTVLGDELLFFTDDGIHGLELWKTDGTQQNTRMIKDIYPGPNGSYSDLFQTPPSTNSIRTHSHNPVILNGKLFFFADDGVNGISLWRSDGTEQGTYMVKDFSPDIEYEDYMTLAGDVLIFSKSDGSDKQLWQSDGTAEGTVLADENMMHLRWNPVRIGNDVFISKYRSDVGYELFKTDGTEAGTVLVKNINPDDLVSLRIRDSSPNNFVELNGEVYFWAYELVGARNLWKTDGTTEGTVKIPNTNIGGDGIRGMWAVNGKLVYFTYREYMYVNDLSGTPPQRSPYQNLIWDWPGSGGNSHPEAIQINDILYFSAQIDDQSTGTGSWETGVELWKTDGTVSGTTLVKDIYPGIGNNGGSNYPYSSSPYGLSSIDNILYFIAKVSANGELRFARSDGSSSGTFVSFPELTMSPFARATLYKERIYFAAFNSNELNSELVALDLTSTLNVRSSGVTDVPIAASLPGFDGITDYTIEEIDPTTELVLTAPAQSGIHIFDGWSGCDSVVDQDCFIRLKTNTDLTANYVLPRFDLTVNSPDAPGVQIQSSPVGFGGNANAGAYTVTDIEWGTLFNLTAPELYSALFFSGWSGCDTSHGLNCTVDMKSERTVSASYNSVAVRLTGPLNINSLNPVLTLDVTVFGKYPTGYILIKDDGAEVPGCRLLVLDQQTTQCVIGIEDLSPGEHVYTAEYSGDSNNIPASGSFQVSVDKSNDPSLSVFKRGSGSGRVTSNAGYIDCGNKCSVSFSAGSSNVVVLNASSDSGSTFSGWEGASCSGNGSCTITVDSLKGVNAVFLNDSLTDFSKPASSCNGITGNYANKIIDNETIVCTADTQNNLGGNLTIRNRSNVNLKAPVNIISAPFSMTDSTLSLASIAPLPAGSDNSVIAPTGNPASPLMSVDRDGTSALFHYSSFDEEYTGFTLKSPPSDVLQVDLWPDGNLKYVYINGYIFAVSKIVNGLVDIFTSAPDGATELFTDIPITNNNASAFSSYSRIQSGISPKIKGATECDEDDPICSFVELPEWVQDIQEYFSETEEEKNRKKRWAELWEKGAEILEKYRVKRLNRKRGTVEEAVRLFVESEDCVPDPGVHKCFGDHVDDMEDRQYAIDRSFEDKMEESQDQLELSDKFDADDYSGEPTVFIMSPESHQEVPAESTIKVTIQAEHDTGISKLIYYCPSLTGSGPTNHVRVVRTKVFSSPPTSVITSFTCEMPALDLFTIGEQVQTVAVRALSVSGEEVYEFQIVVLAEENEEVEVSLATFVSDTLEEDGSKPGEFEVRRSGALKSDLKVYFTVSGSATNGDDYTGVISQVTIPKDQNTAKIYVHARTDEIDDPDETVTLTLNAAQEDGVTIASASTATVTIIQDAVACDSVQQAGNDSASSLKIDLGTAGREFIFSWQAQTVKDRFSLSFGTGSFTTGCISGSGSVTRNSGSSRFVTVTVSPNCEGTTGTAWDYTVSCPE